MCSQGDFEIARGIGEKSKEPITYRRLAHVHEQGQLCIPCMFLASSTLNRILNRRYRSRYTLKETRREKMCSRYNDRTSSLPKKINCRRKSIYIALSEEPKEKNTHDRR